MPIVRLPNELRTFYRFLYISLALAGFLMVMIIFEKQFQFSRPKYVASAVTVLILLFSPLAVVYREEYKFWQSKRQGSTNHNYNQPPNDFNILTEAPIAAAPPPSAIELPPRKADSCFENVFRPPDRGEDYTILQALFSIDMLILFLATICSLGGTLTAIDNLDQIGSTLRYPNQSISTFVSLVSIWKYLGRVVAGFVSEIFLKKYKFPRPLMLTLILLLSCLGHLLIAFNVPNGLYFASVLIGFCFGAQWPLLHAIISEIFGLKYYSTLYNFGGMASPIGSYILNVMVAGHLYDKEAKRQLIALGRTRLAGEDLDCVGVECFKSAFIIITAVTVFGALISVILVVRTRKFYQSDIYKKFKEEPREVEMDMAVAVNGVEPTEKRVGVTKS